MQISALGELFIWLDTELSQWEWLRGVHIQGPHRETLQAALNNLAEAKNAVNRYAFEENSGRHEQMRNLLAVIHAQLSFAFIERGLPHSSTPHAKRIRDLQASSAVAALSFAYAIMANKTDTAQVFSSLPLDAWYGLVLGLAERYGLAAPDEGLRKSQTDALDDLRRRSETLLGENRVSVNAIEAKCAELDTAIDTVRAQQKTDFELMLQERVKKHEVLANEHEKAMEAIQTTFKAKMELRAPVDYWKTKEAEHANAAGTWMWAAFGSMATAAVALGVAIFLALGDTPADKNPATWRVASLAMLAVLAVWAIRLVVRIFLSHTHLQTDAAERVTMVMTYLALMEAEKIPGDEDRKLILAPLFRPAADGLVKDEGLPHPALDLLTKMGRS